MPAPILVSPAEPSRLRDIGYVAGITESYGADFMIPGPGYLIGIQRKVFPGDFLSSLEDGRLAESLIALSKLPVRILLLEGRPSWTFDGALQGEMHGSAPSFRRSQLRSLLWSAQLELGVAHHWTDGIADTADFLRDLARWAEKGSHVSLFRRPAPPQPEWVRKFSDVDRAAWFLQGIEGWGPVMARAVAEHFGGRLPMVLTASESELLAIPGVGPGRLAALRAIVPLSDNLEAQ